MFSFIILAVEVRNQRLGHLTEIAFFARYRQTTLKLVVHQVLELNLAPRRRYTVLVIIKLPFYARATGTGTGVARVRVRA